MLSLNCHNLPLWKSMNVLPLQIHRNWKENETSLKIKTFLTMACEGRILACCSFGRECRWLTVNLYRFFLNQNQKFWIFCQQGFFLVQIQVLITMQEKSHCNPPLSQMSSPNLHFLIQKYISTPIFPTINFKISESSYLCLANHLMPNCWQLPRLY